ncbi:MULTISPECIES: protein tyrosine phosphatase [unclassified Psychrobacter]|uniref:low molecular weight protein tyrosine phosphatase family protein n=1 Tax=unclassified Psychrobacter TaxID=196806 RepID=UPI0025B4435A|nr:MULTISPECIES: protein tyrosine phosphatase [unclassified Psychrobacter]MDN3452890.1 protein tyrosine phosphatase [Psychrobacter sp. APC 3350]MDN3502088.1 protein tyrosine phosphatase [Psychrobacter sp. 5A.1]
MNLLFVCTKNKWRSPTAENIYSNHPDLAVRSAGISQSARKRINIKDIHWADIIFVMENKHKRYINEQFRHQLNSKNIIVLDIPDDYHYMDKALVSWLQDAIDAHLSL